MMEPSTLCNRYSTRSWMAALLLGVTIFGLIRATVWLWGGERAHRMTYDWLEWWTGSPGHSPLSAPAAIIALVLFAAVIIITLITGKISSDRQKTERRGLYLGTAALYLPAFAGSLPAIIGLVSAMVTPFLGGGMISVAADLLQRIGLSHSAGEWVARGIVGFGDRYGYSNAHFLIAQVLFASGLAITIVGFKQVFGAYKDKRLEIRGLYATIRHPQHLGIALWTFGLALAVSSTAGYMMWFTVFYLYVVLALWEERHLIQQFGPSYQHYRAATPFILPFVYMGLPLPGARAQRIASLVAYYIVGLAILCFILQMIGVEHGRFL